MQLKDFCFSFVSSYVLFVVIFTFISLSPLTILSVTVCLEILKKTYIVYIL